jgi:hypothetical protein
VHRVAFELRKERQRRRVNAAAHHERPKGPTVATDFCNNIGTEQTTVMIMGMSGFGTQSGLYLASVFDPILPKRADHSKELDSYGHQVRKITGHTKADLP